MIIVNTLALMFGYIILGGVALTTIAFAAAWVYLLVANIGRFFRYRRVCRLMRNPLRRSVYDAARESLNFLSEIGVPKGVTLNDAYDIINRYKNRE